MERHELSHTSGLEMNFEQRILKQKFRDPLSLFLSVGTTPFFLIFFHSLIDRETQISFGRLALGILVFSIILLVFSAGLLFRQELDNGLHSLYRLLGINSSRILFGFYGVSLAEGFVSFGISSIFVLIFSPGELQIGINQILGVFLCISFCLFLGFWIAILTQSPLQTFFVSSSIMFLLLLFSGILFPMPKIKVFSYLPTALVHSLLLEPKSNLTHLGFLALESLTIALVVFIHFDFKRKSLL